MEYRISGGMITMSKRFFAKESLKAGSQLRRILGLDFPASKKVQLIERQGTQVIIRYQTSDRVILDEHFPEFFEDMKKNYDGQITGKLMIAMEVFGTAYVDVLFE